MIHVQQILGYRDMKSIVIYINLEQALFNVSSDKFHVKTVKNAKEACELAEVGFGYFDTVEGVLICRMRK